MTDEEMAVCMALWVDYQRAFERVKRLRTPEALVLCQGAMVAWEQKWKECTGEGEAVSLH